MTDTEKTLLKDYKKMLDWECKGTKMVEFEGMMIDERILQNENIRKKYFNITEKINLLYQTEEGKKEVEKIIGGG
jgi:hypothetical protein